MSKRYLILILVLVAGAASGLSDLLVQGDQAEAAFDNTRALKLYQQAWNADPGAWDTNLRLVRSTINVGEDAPEDQKEKYFRKAMGLAENFASQFPDSAAPYLYVSMAYGRMALFLGGKEKVKLSREI